MTKEEKKNYDKAYYQKNKEKLLKQSKTHYKDNHDRAKEVKRSYYFNNKDKYKEYVLEKVYGISLEEYNEIFERQKGCCNICGTHQLEFTKKLAVDHCHITGRVRGLLCTCCNLALGKFKDSEELLLNAIKHLK